MIVDDLDFKGDSQGKTPTITMKLGIICCGIEGRIVLVLVLWRLVIGICCRLARWRRERQSKLERERERERDRECDTAVAALRRRGWRLFQGLDDRNARR